MKTVTNPDSSIQLLWIFSVFCVTNFCHIDDETECVWKSFPENQLKSSGECVDYQDTFALACESAT